ncbi:DUF1194 domain-containing protein [Psychromarinibacter sp. C21-152]|uniref:DUF1194 domain-containing protein n=1 Tax=Psychromarinibacter sediminicola TaxID=3033385 RepID=A0AAE3NYP7_9RHOB|nr:DUF1194 domain-containing protein [Psychromarinibacter sediminicola]MDF0603137.1 DUF1194 domain-containing protein [Psychromarinibacter sediminicola]
MRRALVLLAWLVSALPAGAACRQALALGLDVSGSVDAVEYRLQLDGLAAALLRPEVQQAFLAFPEAPVRLYVFEWAGSADQRRLVDWREIGSAGDLADVAAVLTGTGRVSMAPATAIGVAMRTGAEALAAQGDCDRRVLDLSGDGKSNVGPRPRTVKRDPALAGITVNGLVVGADPRSASDARGAAVGELLAYYRNEVIHGPGAFTELALGFEGFEGAMAKKLLRELQTLAVAGRGPRP